MVDRDQVRERMHVALLEGRIGETPWGPRLGVRWWRFGAGLMLGLACATKWSGLYFIVFFGVMTLAFDIAARRQYRVPRPWVGAFRRDLGPSLYALVLIPFGVYLASYAPWFASETGVNRHEVGNSIGPDSVLPLPDAVRSLWHYTHAAYRFHAGLTNADGNHHPWESKPWTWPMSLRPVLYAIDNQNVPGCGAQSCVKAVMLVGTPAMWFIAVPVLVWAVWRAFVKRDWRYGAILVGLQRRIPAVVRRHRPADVLLLRGDDGAVPGADARDDSGRHPAQAQPELRATDTRADRGELLYRPCHYELRVDVPDPDGPADLAGDMEHADLAAVLALNFAHRVVFSVIHSPGRNTAVKPHELSARTASIAACERSSSAARRWPMAALPGRACVGTIAPMFPDIYLSKLVVPSLLQQTTIGAWLWSGRDGVIAGRAAASLHGALWIDATTPIEMIWRSGRPPRGILVRNERIDADDIVLIDGMPVTTPERTAFDLARHLSRDVAVRHLDALARATGIKAAEVAIACERYPRARGLPRSRIALPLMDGGAESPQETRVRLILIDDGLPPPRTQIRVSDGLA